MNTLFFILSLSGGHIYVNMGHEYSYAACMEMHNAGIITLNSINEVVLSTTCIFSLPETIK